MEDVMHQLDPALGTNSLEQLCRVCQVSDDDGDLAAFPLQRIRWYDWIQRLILSR